MVLHGSEWFSSRSRTCNGSNFCWLDIKQNHEVLGITISDSWRNIFVLPIIIIAIAFILSFFFMKDVIPNRKLKLDLYSLILSCIGFGLFLWGFSNVASEGWGNINYVILPIFKYHCSYLVRYQTIKI